MLDLFKKESKFSDEELQDKRRQDFINKIKIDLGQELEVKKKYNYETENIVLNVYGIKSEWM